MDRRGSKFNIFQLYMSGVKIFALSFSLSLSLYAIRDSPLLTNSCLKSKFVNGTKNVKNSEQIQMNGKGHWSIMLLLYESALMICILISCSLEIY